MSGSIRPSGVTFSAEPNATYIEPICCSPRHCVRRQRVSPVVGSIARIPCGPERQARTPQARSSYAPSAGSVHNGRSVSAAYAEISMFGEPGWRSRIAPATTAGLAGS